MANELRERGDNIAQIWPRESGVPHSTAKFAAGTFGYYAGLGDTFDWEKERSPAAGRELGPLVREPVGVVGAIIPWNGPLGMIGPRSPRR